jgi:hypothetical protein
MSFFDIIGQSAIFYESSFDLQGELLEVGRPWTNRSQLAQSLVNSFQLLVTRQTTPRKRFASAAVDSIPNSHADLSFNLVSFRIWC